MLLQHINENDQTDNIVGLSRWLRLACMTDPAMAAQMQGLRELFEIISEVRSERGMRG